MANGDAAAAQGWTVVPSTDDVKVGYDDINYAMDRTADEVERATAAEALKLDAAVIQIATTEDSGWANGTVWLKPVS